MGETTRLLSGAHYLRRTKKLAKTFIKHAIMSAPALGLPDNKKDFHLYVHESGYIAAGILAQEHGTNYLPVVYLSKTLDNIAQGLPTCLRAAAAAALMVRDAEKTVLSHPLMLRTSHQVNAILHNLGMQHLMAQHCSGYGAMLLAPTNLPIKPTSVPHTAVIALRKLLCTADQTTDSTDEVHDCLKTIETETACRTDVLDVVLEERDSLQYMLTVHVLNHQMVYIYLAMQLLDSLMKW